MKVVFPLFKHVLHRSVLLVRRWNYRRRQLEYQRSDCYSGVIWRDLLQLLVVIDYNYRSLVYFFNVLRVLYYCNTMIIAVRLYSS